MALTPTQKLRYSIGDADPMLPVLPDDVYAAVISDNTNATTGAINWRKCVLTLASYVCAALTQSTREKVAQMEIFGADRFKNYVQFINKVLLNPALACQALSVYYTSNDAQKRLITYKYDFDQAYVRIVEDDRLKMLGSIGVKQSAWDTFNYLE